MRTFFALAALLAAHTIVLAQTKIEQVASKDAPQVIVVKETLPPTTADLPLAGDCTIPKGATFPEAVFVPSATIVDSSEELSDVTIKPGKPVAATIKVKGITKLPAKTVLTKGFVLTVPHGTKLPEVPKVVVPPEPVGVRIGLEKVPFSEIVKDPQLLADYLAANEKRLTKVEAEVKLIKQKLEPAEKAERLKMKPTGEEWWTYNCVEQKTDDKGRPVQFTRSYTATNNYTVFVYKVLQ